MVLGVLLAFLPASPSHAHGYLSWTSGAAYSVGQARRGDVVEVRTSDGHTYIPLRPGAAIWQATRAGRVELAPGEQVAIWLSPRGRGMAVFGEGY